MTVSLRGGQSRLARLGALAVAVLQLLLGPALAVTDAATQAQSASPVAVHVEDHSHAECRSPHDARCVVCQQLQTVATPTEPCAPPLVVRATPAAAAASSTSGHSARHHRLPPSRGPPNTA